MGVFLSGWAMLTRINLCVEWAEKMKKDDADQLIRCVKECWWRVLLLLTAPIALVSWAIHGWPVTISVEDGVAAWVQAIGSILAIAGAALIARSEFKRSLAVERRQIRRQRAAQRERQLAVTQMEISKIISVYQLCKEVLDITEDALNKDDFKLSAEDFINRVNAAERLVSEIMVKIDKVPVYMHPYSYLASEVIMLREVQTQVVSALSQAASKRRSDGRSLLTYDGVLDIREFINPKLRSQRESLVKALNNAVEEIKKLN
ncbi:hypothetical protein LNA76_06000 [Alcaligenes sp. MMA]|uniref:hypothetical protein n=1 Tax=Alcaligenes sp. MMA TaxID=2893019 RepID=UPI001E293456|nr:hypothetical protein [Alcaligenes sp. MMA]MCC9162878.1 hypothetical protein [Alcaligenes sp. MMA]